MIKLEITYLYKYKINPTSEFYVTLADRLGLEYIEDGDLIARENIGTLLPITVAQEGQIILLNNNPTFDIN